jgi:hypothetical protein
VTVVTVAEARGISGVLRARRVTLPSGEVQGVRGGAGGGVRRGASAYSDDEVVTCVDVMDRMAWRRMAVKDS